MKVVFNNAFLVEGLNAQNSNHLDASNQNGRVHILDHLGQICKTKSILADIHIMFKDTA